MKLKLISCEALYRESMMIAARSPHLIDITFMPFGLHDTPSELRKSIQQEIDDSEIDGYEFIMLCYGLCSRGTAEVRARSVPLVVPRAHDCITLFLGSRSRYSEEFSSHPGTYYYSPGWIERKDGTVQQGNIEESKSKEQRDRYQEYVAKYGEDNARFLIEQESQWLDHYTRAAFVDTGVGDTKTYRDFTHKTAMDHGWDYEDIKGDLSLVERLLYGIWDSEDFLIVKPGKMITESFDDQILREAE